MSLAACSQKLKQDWKTNRGLLGASSAGFELYLGKSCLSKNPHSSSLFSRWGRTLSQLSSLAGMPEASLEWAHLAAWPEVTSGQVPKRQPVHRLNLENFSQTAFKLTIIYRYPLGRAKPHCWNHAQKWQPSLPSLSRAASLEPAGKHLFSIGPPE